MTVDPEAVGVPVTLTKKHDILHGYRYTRCSDEPPLVVVPSLRVTLFLSVWERRGWSVA